MATIKYTIKSKSNPTPIYCRYVNTRSVDITTSTNILINSDHWDNSKGKARHVIDFYNAGKLNKQLALLEHHIYDSYNLDYMDGKIIDKSWLDNVIRSFFNRPKGENKIKNENHTIYYTDFARWWLKEKSEDWLVGPHKYLSEREIAKYAKFVEMVEDFQGKDKIRLLDTTNKLISKFAIHLSEDDYASATIKRHVGRFKFFCLRAEELDYGINKSFKQRVFVPADEEILEPYLNPIEIETIFNHDFSHSEYLDNARDNLVIACWTGLRCSDFLKLDIENFIDDYIELKTQKTKTKVVIPLHPLVKKILIKRNGKLPKKISDQKFNKAIKEVCKLAKINKKMRGKLFDGKKKRNVSGTYEKHKLISSHVGRRSFASNLYGKISNSVIMAVAGWSKPEMLLNYIKKSNRDHAVELKSYWEKIYNE